MESKKGIECPVCLERMFSWHVHDFKFCKGGHVFIDGGDEYMRCSWTPDGRKPETIEFDPKKDKKPK